MNVRNVIELVYGVPAILSYLVVFYALITLRKELPNNFIYIMTLMSITNIATWTWVFLKLSSEPLLFIYFSWLNDNPWMMSKSEIHTFLITHFYYAQNLDVLILTFDRFCAIYGRQKDMRWWTKRYIPIIVVAHMALLGVQFFLQIPMTVNMFFDSSKVQKDTASGIFQISFGVIVMIACTVFSAYSQRILSTWKKTYPTAIVKSSFITITCCIVVIQFCNLVATMASRIGQMTNALTIDQLYILHEIMLVTSDMFSLLPPLYIIFVPEAQNSMVYKESREYLGKRQRPFLNTPPAFIRCFFHVEATVVAMNTRNIVELCYGIPGILTYFVVFYAVFILRRKLPNGFMLIYSIMAITNIATWLNTWIYLKLSNEPFFFFYFIWLTDQPTLIKIHTFLISYFYYVQNINVLFLSADRLIAIYGDLGLFARWFKFSSLSALFIHALIFMLHLLIKLPMKVSLTLNPSTGGYEFSQVKNGKETMSIIFQITVGILLMVVCAFFNIWSHIILHRMKERKPNIKTPFLLICSCVVLTQLCNLIAIITTAIARTTNFLTNQELIFVYECMLISSDMFNLLPGIFFMTFPGPICKELVKKLFPCWMRKKENIAIINLR
uniref:Serpentine receptor class gamma n=1 Tax=Pristionchus pacificus TaxID=54126 RepID=A0A8R1YNT1_PRIPA